MSIKTKLKIKLFFVRQEKEKEKNRDSFAISAIENIIVLKNR